jgi:hypothetical protein
MTQRASQAKLALNQPGQPRKNYVVAEYDFAIEGGAVSQITLRGDTLPSGAFVDEAVLIVETVPTSGGGATVSVDSEAAADLNAADAISGAPWSVAKSQTLDKLYAVNAGVKTTADRAIKITVGTAALTAGKFKVVVGYWLI